MDNSAYELWVAELGKTRSLLFCNDILSCRGSLKQCKPSDWLRWKRAVYCAVWAKKPHLSFIWDPSLMQSLNCYHSGTKRIWFPFLQTNLTRKITHCKIAPSWPNTNLHSAMAHSTFTGFAQAPLRQNCMTSIFHHYASVLHKLWQKTYFLKLERDTYVF